MARKKKTRLIKIAATIGRLAARAEVGAKRARTAAKRAAKAARAARKRAGKVARRVRRRIR